MPKILITDDDLHLRKLVLTYAQLERYQRSQHQGGRSQGTGLGLSIVSSILKAHGMSYGVGCRDGLTVFWFSAPINEKGDMSS